jgi:hypothetical protein
VVQRCLEKGTRKQKLELADHIINNLAHLIEDPFGNYLVQNVLKLADEERIRRILDLISRDFIRLSQMKFSSNVIEQALDSIQPYDNLPLSHIDHLVRGTLRSDDLQVKLFLNEKG